MVSFRKKFRNEGIVIIHPQATEKTPITYPGKRREEKPSNNSQQNRIQTSSRAFNEELDICFSGAQGINLRIFAF